MSNECIRCKGSNPKKYCGRTFCPIYKKSEAMFKSTSKIQKDSYFGASPNLFVGRYGWPDVNVGLLTPPEVKEEAWKYDAPRHWAKENYKIPSIVNYRGSLVNSRFKSSVFVNNSKFLETSQEVSMASRPVDVEINLKHKPYFKMQFNADILPMGANAELDKARITENPKIDTKVDKVNSDSDMKSNEALQYLYKSDYDENFLSKLLSLGNIGVKKNRKLVPTRWSITAVDDNLGKHILNEIRNLPSTDYLAYFNGYLGNYFLILFMPDIWSYELFETYLPKASWNQSSILIWTTDHELFRGRTNYAYETTGGYYASRLPILEKLRKMKRQSTVLVLRFITNEYEVPLGVWVVREAVRKTMESTPLNFSSKELMLKYVNLIIKKKFSIDVNQILNNSIILKNFNEQQKLVDYF